MKLVFASNNVNKLDEIRKIMLLCYEIRSLNDINCTANLPETGNTLEANAMQKARYVFDNYHVNCFADDTGLEVDALNGMPGVYSARYAGENKDADDNMDKLLHEMKNVKIRSAQFRTVIAAIINGSEFFCEGTVKGKISAEKSGSNGFGYDPVFIPEGQLLTFAQMSADEKNKMSHRAIAIRNFLELLKTQM